LPHPLRAAAAHPENQARWIALLRMCCGQAKLQPERHRRLLCRQRLEVLEVHLHAGELQSHGAPGLLVLQPSSPLFRVSCEMASAQGAVFSGNGLAGLSHRCVIQSPSFSRTSLSRGCSCSSST
jgi:hypothetical protein